MKATSGALTVSGADSILTDRYPEAATRFGVRGIPTLIVFSGGREVARQLGAVPRAGLEALLKPLEAAR